MSRNRPGITLIEVLVVISVSSLVMFAGGVLLHSIYRADKETRLALESESSVARLSLQFRRDAHAAAEATMLAGAKNMTAGVVFRGPAPGTIEYRGQGRAVVRTAKQADQVVHRDSFGLPAGTELDWKLEQGPPTVAALQIARTPPRGVQGAALVQQRIEAVVGLAGERRRER